MKLGRKPKHAFNTLKIGEKVLLTGRARVHPHQFIYQYNKGQEGAIILKVIWENGKAYAERVELKVKSKKKELV